MGERVLAAATYPRVGSIIVAPQQFALTGNEFLRVRLWCFAARTWTSGQRLFRLVTRTAPISGPAEIGAQDITADPNSNPQTRTLQLQPGALQTAAVEWAGTTLTALPGLAYGVVDLCVGDPAAANMIVGTLAAGYVGPGLPLTWPNSPIAGPLEGRGYFSALLTSATAGNEVALPVGTSEVWRVRAVFARYTADGTVAPRRPRLVFNFDGSAAATFPSATSITAGQTVDTVWMPGAALGVGSAAPDAVAPIPENLTLRGTDTLTTSTVNRQAMDQYVNFNVLVDRYVEALP